MVPEYGHFSLILSLCLAVLLACLPLWGAHRNNVLLMRSAFSLSAGLFLFVTLAFVCLAYAFWMDDFSVIYVANNSNTLLPQAYKISAVWSAHEGSLLLWVWLLTLWIFAVSIFSRHLPLPMIARVLAVMGFVTIGFLLFTLLTSNPFLRYLPFAPMEGNDLNPLLQDFGLIIHPPMLYLGYVGFSVAFAFAIAALLSGQFDSYWVRWTRPWTLIAWAFLTLGIALGSWWAYYELGWGGWWFWDPVENASLMPWIAGTALLHSLAVSEKRGVFKSWTLLLAIFAFSLSLLGTFLVRSGVLTSVHAFASDPERGYFILAFLAVVIGGSLALYALRAPALISSSRFEWLSKESALLLNNVLLVIFLLVVLLGTLYPLLADAMQWGKISVGPPYFDFFFKPLMLLLLLLLPVGTLLKWKCDNLQSRKRWLISCALLSVVMSALLVFIFADRHYLQGMLVLAVALWVILLMLLDMLYQMRHTNSFWAGWVKLSRSYKGMLFAHLGLAVAILGIGLNSLYSESMDVRLAPGQHKTLANYSFTFQRLENVQGPNYQATRGTFVIGRLASSDDVAQAKTIITLYPEKRHYFSDRGNAMTEAGIDPGFWRDVYVSMGEPLEDKPNGAWAVRLHVKPFVRWIWLGAILMALGALLSMSDKRYQLQRYFSHTQAAETQA